MRVHVCLLYRNFSSFFTDTRVWGKIAFTQAQKTKPAMTRISPKERTLPEQTLLCIPWNGEDGEEERIII